MNALGRLEVMYYLCVISLCCQSKLLLADRRPTFNLQLPRRQLNFNTVILGSDLVLIMKSPVLYLIT